VPLDVLQHIARGLRDVRDFKKPPLPQKWENEMRQLICRQDTRVALLAAQVARSWSAPPLAQVLTRLAHAILGHWCEAAVLEPV
jgi:hypothetical protein